VKFYLIEDVRNYMKNPYLRGTKLNNSREILKNPKYNMCKTFQSWDEYHNMRALVCIETQDFYCFDAYEYTHKDILHKNNWNLEQYIPIMIYRDGFVNLNNTLYDYEEDFIIDFFNSIDYLKKLIGTPYIFYIDQKKTLIENIDEFAYYFQFDNEIEAYKSKKYIENMLDLLVSEPYWSELTQNYLINIYADPTTIRRFDIAKKIEIFNPLLENKNETYIPPVDVSKEAQEVLDWRDEYGRDVVQGGTRIGWTRANQLAKREPVSLETIQRMYSFFKRHKGNEKINPEFKEEPYKDKGYVSHKLWGGGSGFKWVQSILDK
jgi:hypothetical protein